MKLKLRKHQIAALKNTLKEFKTNNKATVVLPCGTGKTVVMGSILEELNLNSAVVFAPTILLTYQNFVSIKSNSNMDFEAIMISSKKDESYDLSKVDYRIKNTTDFNELSSFIDTCERNDKKYIIFSTYMSNELLSGLNFDIIMYDEAHRTAGSTNKLAANSLFIDSQYKYFTTATPRILKKQRDANPDQHKQLTNGVCMNDTSIYGNVAFSMSFKEAIQEGYITDYNVVIYGIDLAKVPSEFLIDDETLAIYAAKKAFNEIPNVKKMLTFHNRCIVAKNFAEFSSKVMPEIKSFYVDGKMKVEDRNDALRDFIECDRGLMANVKVLAEGADYPAIDTVLFASKKTSVPDIVQAVGRALRLYKGKEKAHILLPIFYNPVNETEKVLIDSHASLNIITNTLLALSSMDERIESFINSVSTKKDAENLNEILNKEEGSNNVLHDETFKFLKDLNEGKLPITFDGLDKILMEAVFFDVVDRSRNNWFATMKLAYCLQFGEEEGLRLFNKRMEE
jgi:predicted helicase